MCILCILSTLTPFPSLIYFPLLLTPSFFPTSSTDMYVLAVVSLTQVAMHGCIHSWLQRPRHTPYPGDTVTLSSSPSSHSYILSAIPPPIVFAGPWERWYKCPVYVWARKCYQFSVLSPVNHLSTTKISFSKQGWKWPWTDCLNINIQKAVFHVYLL